jgi:pepsin A
MIENEYGAVFDEVPFEGIVGLAFPSMSANHVQPFFDTVIGEKTLQHNEFAFYFSKENRAGNALLWGGVDPAFYSGQIEYFNVTDPYYWSLDLHSFQIGNHVLLSSPEGPRTVSPGLLRREAPQVQSVHGVGVGNAPARAIVDTGTTFFTAEDDVYTHVMELLPNARCGDITDGTHPPIVYKLRNAAGGIRAFSFTFRDYMTHEGEGDFAFCRPAFMRINVPREHGPGMVLGEVFMRSYFSVFDRGGGTENAKIGFAEARHTEDCIKRLGELTNSQPLFRPGGLGEAAFGAGMDATVGSSTPCVARLAPVASASASTAPVAPATGSTSAAPNSRASMSGSSSLWDFAWGSFA